MILLDTHVLVWTKAETKRMSQKALQEIERARREDEGVAISAITIWELALLVSRGRIQSYGTVDVSVRTLIHGVVIVPISAEIAAISTQFPDDYPRDPADRIIGGTARAEGLTLVTHDERIRRSPLIRTLW